MQSMRDMWMGFILLAGAVFMACALFIPAEHVAAEAPVPRSITYYRIGDNLTVFSPLPAQRVVCIWTERTDTYDTGTYRDSGLTDVEVPAGLSCMQFDKVDFESYADRYAP